MTYFRPNIDRMAGYQPGEQPQAGPVIKLNTNENPYPPSPRVMEAIRQAVTEQLRKYPDPIATVFREHAARLFGLEPDWILAGNGSDDILTIATRSFVAPGDRIVAPTPSYLLYRSLAEIQGAEFFEVPFTADWDLSDEFARHDARLTFLPNPNSPSGTMLSLDRVRKIASRLDGRSPLVIDEAYADFSVSNCVPLVREFPNVIVTRTLSKSYSLAGIRFGFAMARPELIAGLCKVKDSYNCDAISIAAAAAALADQEHLARNTERICVTRRRATDALRHLGFTVPESQANFIWCTDGPAPSQAIYQRLKSRGILVRYIAYPSQEGIRVSIGSDAEIDRLLEELTRILADLRSR